MASASFSMSAAACSEAGVEAEIEATELATKSIKTATGQEPPAKPSHEEETTDGGSSLSDSEGSISSGVAAARSASPAISSEGLAPEVPAPEAAREPAQKAAAPATLQGSKSRGGKAKGGRNQQPVSSLRSALRSQGNAVIAEVATCHPPFLSNPLARPAAAGPIPQSAWPLAAGRSMAAAPVAPGLGAAMPSYPLRAQPAAPLPRPNSVAVPCRRPPAVPPAMPAGMPAAMPPTMVAPPGLEPTCASARGLYGAAIDDGYYYDPMAYELEYAFEQGRAFQREAAARAMAAADTAAAVDYADYAAAAMDPQKLPMYAHANELPPAFDPELPVKKRVPSFLAETSMDFACPWGAERAWY